jgi:nucleoside-diphosphate-sugar epimerase
MEASSYNMKIFVTGGTGFIGQHVVRQLVNDGHTVVLLCLEDEQVPSALNSRQIQLVRGNLSNIDAWSDEVLMSKPDAMVHLAWEGIPQYDAKTSAKNLMYGLNLITMMAEAGCKKILCTGSCWEYGQKTGELTEDAPVNVTNAFTAAKYSLYMMGKEIAKEHTVEFIWTRLFYVYGPGQKSHSLIPHIVESISAGRKPDIRTPHTKNDFIYVEDVASAVSLLLAKKTKGNLYNIGSGYSTEIVEVINEVYRLFDDRQTFECSNSAPSDSTPVNFWANITKIKQDTGWVPKYDIAEGIKKTVQSWKS